MSMTGKQMGSTPSTEFGQVLQQTLLEAEPQADMSPGQYIPSDDPFDMAIEGEGFFELQRPDGNTIYTRDGRFRLNAQNVLVSKDGLPVQSSGGGELQFAPGAGDPRVDTQGRIFQGLNQIGEVAVVGIGNLSAIEPVTGGFAVREGQDARIADVDDPMVSNHVYESSNVAPVREMVALIATSRAYEANSKVVQTHDQQLERVINTFAVQ